MVHSQPATHQIPGPTTQQLWEALELAAPIKMETTGPLPGKSMRPHYQMARIR